MSSTSLRHQPVQLGTLLCTSRVTVTVGTVTVVTVTVVTVTVVTEYRYYDYCRQDQIKTRKMTLNRALITK